MTIQERQVIEAIKRCRKISLTLEDGTTLNFTTNIRRLCYEIALAVQTYVMHHGNNNQ